MKLPPPPARYTPVTEAARNRTLEQADAFNMKTNAQNVLASGSIVLQAPNGTFYQLVVSNTGVLSTIAVTP